MTVLGTVITIAVFAVLFLALRRPGDAGTERRDATDQANKWLFGGGLALPFVTVVVVFAVSLVSMRAMPFESDGAMVVEVTAQQFWWELTYPDADAVTANEIHIPVDTPVEFRLHSLDVIHSFWVPALGGKMDALPDYTNTLILEADEPGRYEGQCAEFCGIAHAHMGIVVVAEPLEDFEAWLELQAAPADEPESEAAIEGRQVFEDADCGRCHTIRGTEFDGDLGPDLTHVAGREMLAARTFANEPDRLRSWILDPHEIKPGNEMVPTDLDEAQLDALIAYLESLR